MGHLVGLGEVAREPREVRGHPHGTPVVVLSEHQEVVLAESLRQFLEVRVLEDGGAGCRPRSVGRGVEHDPAVRRQSHLLLQAGDGVGVVAVHEHVVAGEPRTDLPGPAVAGAQEGALVVVVRDDDVVPAVDVLLPVVLLLLREPAHPRRVEEQRLERRPVPGLHVRGLRPGRAHPGEAVVVHPVLRGGEHPVVLVAAPPDERRVLGESGRAPPGGVAPDDVELRVHPPQRLVDRARAVGVLPSLEGLEQDGPATTGSRLQAS